MKKIFLIALLLIVIGSNNSFSQSYLGITKAGIIALQDTATFGDYGIYNVWVKNYGPAAFLGDINVVTGIKQLYGYPPYQINNATLSNVALNMSDSIQVSQNILFDDAVPFKAGINVIIVWPMSPKPDVFTKDSIVDSIFIIRPNGISQIKVRDIFTFYPNPVKSDLILNPDQKMLDIEESKILDINGKFINNYHKQLTIEMSDYKAGTYLLEITFSNGSKRSYKILKQ